MYRETQLLNKLMIKLHVNMAVAQYRASSTMLIQQQDLGGGLFSRPDSSRGVACSLMWPAGTDEGASDCCRWEHLREGCLEVHKP